MSEADDIVSEISEGAKMVVTDDDELRAGLLTLVNDFSHEMCGTTSGLWRDRICDLLGSGSV